MKIGRKPMTDSMWIGAIPLLLVIAADAFVLGILEAGAMAIPHAPAPESHLTFIIMGAYAILAAIVIVPNVVVRSIVAGLLLLGAMAGAASVGMLWIPAVGAAVYAARYQSRLQRNASEN